jgi:hypothetical protein
MKIEDIGMVIVDSTTDLTEDVNNPSASRIVTDGLRTLAESGCVVMNVHHLNKQGGMFGSTQFRKSTRAEIELERRDGSATGIVRTRSNDADPLTIPVTFNSESSPFFSVNGVVKSRTRSPGRVDKVAEARALQRQGKSYREIGETLGIGKSQVGNLLKSGAKAVQSSGQGG